MIVEVKYHSGGNIRFKTAVRIDYKGDLIIVLGSGDEVLGVFSGHNVIGVYQH